MKPTKRTLPIAMSFVLGTAFGIASIVSCSDKATHSDAADAASCNCPAAEPPLTGRFITVKAVASIDPASTGHIGAVGVGCPTGTQLISGGCTGVGVSVPDVVVQVTGFDPDNPKAWSCVFKNNQATNADVQASAICLKPAP
jgi:hypothetical protein